MTSTRIIHLAVLSLFLCLAGSDARGQDLYYASGSGVESLSSTLGSIVWSDDDCGGEFEICTVRSTSASAAAANYIPLAYDNSSGPANQNLASNIAAHDSFVYFALKSGQIVRRPVNRVGDPVPVSTMETSGAFVEVATGTTHVWWLETSADISRLFRAPLDGGARQFIYEASDSPARDLEIDRHGRAWFIAHVNFFLCCLDVLHRVDPGAPASSNVLFSAKAHVDGYVLDEDHVFVAARDSEDANLVISTAPMNDIDSAAAWSDRYDAGDAGPPQIRDMALHGNALLWHQKAGHSGGPILRMDKVGGAATALTGVVELASDLLVAGDGTPMYLYFRGGGQIYRLPIDGAGLTRDLSVDDVPLEVTQTLQDAAHTVPLVEGKRTVVRAWARLVSSSDGATQLSLAPSVVLEGRRGGVPLAGSPLRTTEWRRPLRSGTVDRTRATHQFLFELPESWTSGTVELTARADPLDIVFETDESNNVSTRTVTFERVGGICIDIIPVLTSEGVQQGGSVANRARTFARARTLLPTDDLVWIFRGGTPKSKPWTNEPYNFYEADDMNELMFHWWTDFLFAGTPSHCGTRRAIRSAVVSGAARFGLSSGAAALIYYLQSMGGAVSTNQPIGGVSGLAHEVGHQLGQAHIGCPVSGDNAPANPDGSYPYMPCTIENTNDHVGYDVLTGTIIPPFDAFGMSLVQDYMSYQNDYWVSDYVYRRHYAELFASRQAARSVSPTGLSSGPLLVAAYLRDDGSLEIAPAWHLDAQRQTIAQQALTDSTSLGDDLFVRIIDADGNVPVDQALHVNSITRELAGDPGFTMLFAMTEFQANYKEIQIVDAKGDVLASKSSGVTSPTVSITSPLPGDSLGNEVLVQWLADDADMDELTFRLHYSADGGGEWIDLSTTRKSEAMVDLSALPGGSQVLFEVMATDGFRTVSDVTGPFTIPNRPPDVTILGPDFDDPGESLLIPFGSALDLNAHAYDAEDGPLGSLVWNISGPQNLAISLDRLLLPALDSGNYTVTLTAYDSNQVSGQDTIEVTVGPLEIPFADHVDVDGHCSDGQYVGAAARPLLRYSEGQAVEIQLAQVGKDLLVCIGGLRFHQVPEYLDFLFDRTSGPDKVPQADDRFLRLGIDGSIVTGGWDANGNPYTEEFGLRAYAITEAGGTWRAEIRLPESLLGDDLRMGLRHVVEGTAEPVASWPGSLDAGSPASWAEVRLLSPLLFEDRFETIP